MIRFIAWAILVLTCGAIQTSASIVDPDSNLAGITPQDHNFLRYFYFKNLFDSAQTSYRFGEVKLIVNDTAQRVYLSSLLNDGDFIQGDNNQGVMYNLHEYARTQNFLLPSSGYISYYAHLEALPAPCDASVGDTSDGGICNGFPIGQLPYHWAVGTGRIHDRTEFAVQLLRASDDSILAVFDSVGIAPNPDCIYAKFYGVDPDNVLRKRAIPAGFQGELAYLRISPRRYGTTNYGITLLNEANKFVALSYTNDGLGFRKFASFTEDSAYFRGYIWNRIVDYYDGEATQTGEYPKRVPRYIFDYGLDTLYYGKYFDKYNRVVVAS
ncbi:hypothetical protein MASR2M18_20570 [Ignavibacteria bacterium]|nr:hypothetical protein [Bacteroidota bacterium]